MSRKNKFNKGRFNLRYLTKEGFRNIRVHKLMTVASITVMLSCMILIGGAYLLYANIQSVIDKVGEQNVVMVFIQDEAKPEQEETLKNQITSLENVKDCTFVSRDESFASVMYSLNSTSAVFEGIDSSILPNSYKVTIEDMAQFDATVSQIKSFDNVLHVRENGELASKIATLQKSVGIISVVVVLILLIVSLFIIANTVRITMYSRSLEISIMKAVGATNWFIRWPFLVEGILIGLISAVVSYGLIFGLYCAAEKLLSEMFSILGNSIVPFADCAINLLITFIITGTVTGAIGSLISLGKYLKEHGKVVAND